MIVILLRLAEGLGHTATWIIILVVIFYVFVLVVFVWYIGRVLRALLEERDPERQHILREVLRDLLELFRRGERR